MTIDANGNLYGTTDVGGAKGDGVVWELVKGSGTSAHTGADPVDGVTFGPDGNLDGTAQGGGPGLSGTAWEIQLGSVSSVPEPSSLALIMGAGLFALAGYARRANFCRKKASV